MKQTYPARQLAVRSRCNRHARKSDNCGPLPFGFPDRPAGSCVFWHGREPGRGRNPATDRDPVFLRPSDRCERSAFRAGVEPWFVRLGGSRGHDQHRQRMDGCDCPRRRRRQRVCTGGHQRADPLSQQVRRAAGQSGVRTVQQGTLCHHRAQEPRHPRALRHRRQNPRRRRRRLLDLVLAGIGASKRN